MSLNKYNESNSSIGETNKKTKIIEGLVAVTSSDDESKNQINNNGNISTINDNNTIITNFDQENFESSRNINKINNTFNDSNKLLLNSKKEGNKNIINITNNNFPLKKRNEKKRFRKRIFKVIRRKRKRLLGTDNIKSKLQTYFLKFLFNFIRLIINNELLIDTNFKTFKVKSEKGSLKNKTIKELLSIKNIENERNIDSIIKKYPLLEKFFNIRCLKIFHNIYYVNKYNLDLNVYGIDKKIVIEDELKLYDYFIEKNKTNIKNNPEYLKKVKLVIKNEFTDSIFNISLCDKNKESKK